MQKTVLVIVFLITGFRLFAQSIDDLSFGTDTTFEVMAWNIEWFPKNGQITVDYVSQIIQALDIDLIALQEIDDKSYFVEMVENLDGWDAYYVDSEYSGLAYIYKSDEIEVLNIFEIYTSFWREFPRAPLVMEMNYKNENMIIINNHLKCCGDEILNLNDPWDEETRRFDACNLLEQYINYNYPNDRVIVLGDLNDILIDNPANNVFMAFLDDAGNYLFADMEIAEGSSSGWSYPGWPSHIDHILITNELFDEFGDDNSDIRTIKIDEYLDGGLYEYDENISDHRPVAMKFIGSENAGFNDAAFHKVNLCNYPNPFINITTISFDPTRKNTEIEIYNMNGQKIQCFPIFKDQSSIVWNAERFPEGVYYAKLIVDKKVRAVNKMVLIK